MCVYIVCVITSVFECARCPPITMSFKLRVWCLLMMVVDCWWIQQLKSLVINPMLVSLCLIIYILNVGEAEEQEVCCDEKNDWPQRPATVSPGWMVITNTYTLCGCTYCNHVRVFCLRIMSLSYLLSWTFFFLEKKKIVLKQRKKQRWIPQRSRKEKCELTWKETRLRVVVYGLCDLMLLTFSFCTGPSIRRVCFSSTTLNLVHHTTFWLIPISSTSPSRPNWMLSSQWWIAFTPNVSNYLLLISTWKKTHPLVLLYYWSTLFSHQGIPCITDCVMAELEKLGLKYRVALRYVLFD